MNARSAWNLRALLALLVSASLVPAAVAQTTPSAPEQPKKEEAVTLEKFEVTGSRVKRLDVETPAPVVSYTEKEIQEKGYINIGDFIQSLPFNTGSVNSIVQTASFTRGAATANPRGLGSQRFLTLVNGRRPATFALPTGGNRQVFDFNSLPAVAIEGIDFLKDGASAIYGADAVTGVFNIRLKKNFTGISTSAYYGNTFGHDSALKEFNVVAGTGEGKTKAMVAIGYKEQNSNFTRDFGFKTTNFVPELGTNKGANLNSTLNFPANITLTSALANAINAAKGTTFPTTGTLVVVGGKPDATPTIGEFARVTTVTDENRFNFANVGQRFPSYDFLQAYAQFDHEFSDRIQAYGNIAFSDNNTYFVFTPAVINFSTEGLTLPANNPFNPFGVPVTTLLARTSFGPPRKFDTESTSMNVVVGLKGNVGEWDWDTGYTHSFNEVASVSRNAISAATFQAALNGTRAGFAGQFFNPFGPSPAGLADSLFTTSTGKNRGESTTWDLTVTNGSLFSIFGGDLGIAGGVEYRDERITTNPDTAAFLGSGGGQPLQGDRIVKSAYAEATLPVLGKMLEFQAAIRYEDYSDFGNSTNPKFGFKFRFPENKIANVMLRGSYSESFQAPPLALIHASQTTGFSAAVLQDPDRPLDPPQQQRVVTGGNPNLLPENGKTYYGGIVVDLPIVKGLSFNVDYFDFKINQVIVTPGAAFLLSDRGRVQFPNAIVRDGPGGPILRLEALPSNNPAALQTYRGVDFGVNYRLRDTRLGNFNFSVDMTRTYEIGNDSGLGGGFADNIGLYNNPRWRGTASTGWSYKNWSAAVAVDYIGKFFNDSFQSATVPGWGENPYTLVNPSITYRGIWGTTITAGALNVFDNEPPISGRDISGFDQPTYAGGALGRFAYIRIRKDF